MVIVIVRSEVPPARMLDGENDLPTIGRDAVTASVSVAEQTPPDPTQEGFVLVTLTGGVMVATFTTCVCACPVAGQNATANKATINAVEDRINQLPMWRKAVLERIPNEFKRSTPDSLLFLKHQTKTLTRV